MRHYTANTEEVKLIFDFIKDNEYKYIEYLLDRSPYGYKDSNMYEGIVYVEYNNNYRFTIHDRYVKPENPLLDPTGSRIITDLNFMIFEESYDIDMLYQIGFEYYDMLLKIVEVARDKKYIGKNLERKLQLYESYK